MFAHALNLHQLYTFQTVARHRSYVRAAEELHFSQPAVSAQVRHLEQSLGVRLFEQIGRQTHLTQAGRELFVYSQKIFSIIDETMDAMEALRSPHYGRLSIGADTTVGSYVVPGMLGKFRQIFPAVEISLEVLNRVSLFDALLNNSVDMAVMSAVPEDAPVEIEPFAYNPLVLIAAPNHRLAGRVDIPIKELGREHFLLREPGSGTRATLETTLREAGVELHISMQVGNNSAIKQGVAAGLGIALISRVALDMELETNRLTILDVEGFPIMRQWRLVHLKDKYLSPTAHAFKAFVLENADRRLRRKMVEEPVK